MSTWGAAMIPEVSGADELYFSTSPVNLYFTSKSARSRLTAAGPPQGQLAVCRQDLSAHLICSNSESSLPTTQDPTQTCYIGVFHLVHCKHMRDESWVDEVCAAADL